MSVVFTDAFTVGANTNIDAYPSGSPDYAYNQGSGADLTVNATNDRVQTTTVSPTYLSARIIDPAVPTGDQEITATCNISGTDRQGYVCARCATDGSANLYAGLLDLTQANEVQIIRFDAGVYNVIASADRGFAGAGTHTLRLKVTGSGATVSLEFQVDATASVTFADTSANRKTSGPPGIAGNSSANDWVDDVSVDNLLGITISPGIGVMSLAGAGTSLGLGIGMPDEP